MFTPRSPILLKPSVSAEEGTPNIEDGFSVAIQANESNVAPTDAATEMISGEFTDEILAGTRPIFHHDANNTGGSSSSSITLSRPTATVDTDLLIAVITLTAASGALAITPPAGWTELTSEQTVTDAALGVTITSQAFAKIAASEPTSWNWSYTPNADSRAGDVMAFTGGKLPTDIAVSSSATQSMTQNYGTLSTSMVTHQEIVVAMCSVAQDPAQSGWISPPVNLTNRTGDLNPAGTNKADMQIWSGYGGSAVGTATKTEADVYISFILIASPADAPMVETASASISGFTDDNTTPSENRSALLRVWLANSAGTDVANPSNANGSNNATNAVVSTAALASNPEVMTSDVGSSIGSISYTSAIYRGWFRARTTLITSTAEVIAQSSTAAFADIVMFTQSSLGGDTNHLSGTFIFDLIAAGVDTLSKLQSLQILHRCTDAVAGVSPAILDVDAGAVDIVATSI